MERIPKSGEIYRHFKGKLYQVVTVAQHTESGEKLVIYQALYGNFGVYARPLAMFTEEVDRKKYPDAAQKYRFEKTDPKACEAEEKTREVKDNGEEEGLLREAATDSSLSPLLLSFVEAEDMEVKLEILSAMEGKASQKDLDILCEALDLPAGSGEIERQMSSIKKYLQMRQKFDGGRLR